MLRFRHNQPAGVDPRWDAPQNDVPATPRSALDDIAWPAIPAPGAATLLALQHQLERSQWWSPAELERHQLRQLALLLDHAATEVPFYGPWLAAAGYRKGVPLTAEAWRRLPVLRRRHVTEAGDAMSSRAVPATHGAVRRIATSGTTGAPVAVMKTQLEQLFWQAITLREELWHARRWQSTMAVIRGFPDGRYPPPEGGRLPDWGSPLADVYPTGPAVALDLSASIAEQAQWLVRHDPDYLLTDAVNLRGLADHFRARGLALPRLREVRAVGDVVDAGLRRACRDAWSVEIVDLYSCAEAGYLALQCPEEGKLHVQAETAMVEILDDAGRPCAPGEVGEVVVTPLHNFASPFIRYAIGDWAERGRPCACGRGLAVIERVLGRTRPGDAA